tara:strand:+ start:344 stop:772 length:429 start_codon:yes stop_codon:yes gene_type:complete
MIRIFFIFFFFIIYGNLSSSMNEIVIFSLINIAFFSILKERKIPMYDFIVYILSSLSIELLIGLPLFISSSLIIIPIILFNYFLNNLSMHFIFRSIAIFVSSLFVIFILDVSIINRLLDIQYLMSIIILISIYIGFKNIGKE